MLYFSLYLRAGFSLDVQVLPATLRILSENGNQKLELGTAIPSFQKEFS
jgi:hypothetical protein